MSPPRGPLAGLTLEQGPTRVNGSSDLWRKELLRRDRPAAIWLPFPSNRGTSGLVRCCG